MLAGSDARDLHQRLLSTACSRGSPLSFQAGPFLHNCIGWAGLYMSFTCKGRRKLALNFMCLSSPGREDCTACERLGKCPFLTLTRHDQGISEADCGLRLMGECGVDSRHWVNSWSDT